jgi:nucleotide-binding universal stress UspA family protein
VLGTHGWGRRIDLSVGSVGAYCARHATVPVALVPHQIPTPRDHLDVVVGVDGSAHGNRALWWTLTHLRPSARVTAVSAFSDDSVAGEALLPSAGNAGALARAELEAAVASVLAQLPQHPQIELAAVAGDARSVLQAASARADILVIGARGHGTLGHLLLGSVSSALTHHPVVPTIVVPHEHRHHRHVGE